MSLEGSTAALLVALVSASLNAPPASERQWRQPLIERSTASRSSIHPAIGTPSATELQSRGVRVTVVLTATAKLNNAAVVMTRENTPSTGNPSAIDDVAVLPDGTFVFSDVPPGAYRIRAHAGTTGTGGNTPLMAMHRVVIGATDVRATLILRPGATMSGQLQAEAVAAAAPATFAGVRVRVPLVDGLAETAEADVLRDGSFTIRGVTPGRHVINLEGLSAPWVLHRVSYRGADITDGGLEADSGQSLNDVRITVTDAATEVSGTVRDAKDESVAGAAVLIIPDAPQFRTAWSRRFGRATTDAAGGFRYRGLPSGEYRIVAAMLEGVDVFRPDLLRLLSEEAVPLTLRPLATPVLDLRLTPARIPSAAAR